MSVQLFDWARSQFNVMMLFAYYHFQTTVIFLFLFSKNHWEYARVILFFFWLQSRSLIYSVLFTCYYPSENKIDSTYVLRVGIIYMSLHHKCCDICVKAISMSLLYCVTASTTTNE